MAVAVIIIGIYIVLFIIAIKLIKDFIEQILSIFKKDK